MNNLTGEPSNNPRNFHADLAMSSAPDVETAINAACRKCFPELLNITKAHKLNDMLGADYFLEFPQCKMETIDVKVRKQDYSLRGDNRTACLEIVANTTSNKKGWTIDGAKHTDWVMFYYIDSGKSYLYNARLLRGAVIRYLPDLSKEGKAAIQTTKSGNGSYNSESLFVAHRELARVMYLNSSNTEITNNDRDRV